jgi:tetratricopeptide (TPR) repeat protein
MTDEKIKRLLQSADRMAGPPSSAPQNLAYLVRKRALRNRRIKIIVLPAAAVFLLAFLCLSLIYNDMHKPKLTNVQAAQLREQVRELNMKIDAAVKLVSDVLKRQQRLERIAKLDAQLARFTDPYLQLRENLNKTAYLLLDQADTSYQKFNDVDSAVETYNRIIELFPDTPSAEQAKQRLIEIQRKTINDYI